MIKATITRQQYRDLIEAGIENDHALSEAEREALREVAETDTEALSWAFTAVSHGIQCGCPAVNAGLADEVNEPWEFIRGFDNAVDALLGYDHQSRDNDEIHLAIGE